jgi:membrane fusion protein, heavy metal efflux system
MNRKSLTIAMILAAGLVLAFIIMNLEPTVDREHEDHESAKHEDHESGKHEDHDEHGSDENHEPAKHEDEDHEPAKHEDENHESGKHEDHDEHGSGEEHEEKMVSISPEEMAEFQIKTGVAGPGKLETYINLPGEIAVNATRLAHIVPRVSGVVREVRKNIGDMVRAGQIMAVLESSELAEAKTVYFQRKKQLEISTTDLSRAQTVHDNTLTLLGFLKSSLELEAILDKTQGLNMGKNKRLLISAYTNFRLTQVTYEREKNLYEKKISSQSDYLLAESNYKKAQARYAAIYDEVSFDIKRQLLERSRAADIAKTALLAAERNLHVLGTSEKEIRNLKDGKSQDFKVAQVEILAPITGKVIEKHITLGEMLRKDAKVFVLADLSSVYVNLSVYQKDMPLIRKGLNVIISTDKDVTKAMGKISYVRSIVGEQTRTALARVVLPNPKGLWRPGMFITGRVTAGEVSVPLAVPKTALEQIEGQTVIFIKTNEGFHPQPVTTGRASKTHVEIISGIKPGQQYVTQGGFTLKAQLAKGGFNAGHSH